MELPASKGVAALDANQRVGQNVSMVFANLVHTTMPVIKTKKILMESPVTRFVMKLVARELMELHV